MKNNGVFIFVISHIVPEIFTIFVLCKLGTDDVIRCDSMEVKTQSRELSLQVMMQNNWNLASTLYTKKYDNDMMHVLMLLWQQSCFQSLSAVNQMLPV